MNRAEFFYLVSDRPTTDLARIQLAYWLAKNAHRPFKRDNGERYFEHPRNVAASLIAHGFKQTEFVVAGLLHDVVEDTNTPCVVIVDLFGAEMWRLLEVLSRYMPLFDPVTGQIFQRYKKPLEEYYAAIAKASDFVKIVKCADRLNNLSTCGCWDAERRGRYVNETKQYVLPLATGLRLAYEEEITAVLVELGASL